MKLIVVMLGRGVESLPMPDGSKLTGPGPFEVAHDHYVMRRLHFGELVQLSDEEAAAFRMAREKAEAGAAKTAAEKAGKAQGGKE